MTIDPLTSKLKKVHYSQTETKSAGLPEGPLQIFLEALDKIPLGPPKALRNSDERDWLETDVWTLAYRINQVNYHRDRLLSLLDAGQSTPSALANEPEVAAHLEDVSIEERRLTKVVWDSRPAYEFSAMLAALRSGLDTLANIAATFLKGYARGNNSMHALGKKVESYKGSNALLCLIHKEWLGWVQECKNYRDDLIHHVTIRTHSRSEELRHSAGEWNAASGVVASQERVLRPIVPVVIPRQPEKRVMTRWIWFGHGAEMVDEGIDIAESHSHIMMGDGQTFTAKRDLKFSVNPFHLELHSFAAGLCDHFEQFAHRLLDICASDINFELVTERF